MSHAGPVPPAQSAAGRQPYAAQLERLAPEFAPAMIAWQKVHGRHHLPWQNTRDPYRVWLSEIMLQQTQVATVRGYYDRFVTRFPTAEALAQGDIDEVLGLWSGLGYYSRARNLHRCAQAVVEGHGGRFPPSAEMLRTLPGIGPSTAAAIAAFCFAQPVAIFDGNVKRVLSRLLAFAGDLSEARQQRLLHKAATALLPRDAPPEAMPTYTQALMDLGATVCRLRQPQCSVCPVNAMCQGYAEGAPQRYPVKTKKIKRSALHFSVLWANREDGAVWLERRPDAGIWGGLYCMPMFSSHETLHLHLPPESRGSAVSLQPFVHALTHRDLHLAPVMATVSLHQQLPPVAPFMAALSAQSAGSADLGGREKGGSGAWYSAESWPALGLPAPIRQLLLGKKAAPR